MLVHGGAGDIPDDRDQGKINGVIAAAQAGYRILQEGGSSVEAAEAAVRCMEEDDYFNAGYGSVLTIDRRVEMDASIMDGKNLDAGAVTGITDILHPITVAKLVMTNTNHTFLGGQGAMKFAHSQAVPILFPPGQLVSPYALAGLDEYFQQRDMGRDMRFASTETVNNNKLTQLKGKKDFGEVGTVGAVVIDALGNIAAATSTGGITGKLPGRIGDSPVIGSGTYADNLFGGTSSTGHGESILKFNLAHNIIQRMEFMNENAQRATEIALEQMTARLGATAGSITIDKTGMVGKHFTSTKMAWAYQRGSEVHYGIRKNEDNILQVRSP